MHTFKEGDTDFAVDLSSSQAPFPMPHFVSLHKDDGHPIEDGISVTHKGALFHKLNRKHRGSYSLHIINYKVDNPTEVVGDVISNFSVDVEC